MLIVRIWEGLGNQLFQYAFARALSLRRQDEVRLDTTRIFDEIYTEGNVERSYGLNSFRIGLREATKDDLNAYSFLGRRSFPDKMRYQLSVRHFGKYQFFEETKKYFAPRQIYISENCYLKGWFQNEGYFRQYRNLLLEELTLKKEVQVSKKLQNLLSSDKTIAVHVRRGDYIKTGAALPAAYYQQSFCYLRDLIGADYTYLVFTDDPDWVKKHVAFPADAYYVSEEEALKDYEELIIMSRCAHNVIANSTFSWWGAWLNHNSGQIVISPKRWFLKREYRDDVCITPNRWIRL